MSKEKYFYENREKHYTCHIWRHPNYPKHLHKHIEFAYIAGGELEMTVNDEVRKMTCGDCAFVYPNQIHSYVSQGEVELMLIIVDMDYIGEFFDELTNYELESPFFQREKLSKYGKSILDMLFVSAHEKNVPYEIEKGMVLVLFSDIFHTLPIYKRKKPAELNTTEKLLLYINDNIRNPLAAKAVAKELGISTCYLSHIFSKELKMTFPDYVARQRLFLACDLLKDTKRSITDIAFDIGFTSLRTFLRCFKNQYGCTPKEWRSQHAETSIQPVSAKL